MNKGIPAIIDIEASGFGRGSYPIEVGVVLSDGETHSKLIKPCEAWVHWDLTAEAIHGISRDYLKSHGGSPREVALFLNELLSGQTLYSDAWSFDSSWLGRLFDEAQLVQRFRIETLSKLLTEEEMGVWSNTKDQVVAELGMSMHRAINDVTILRTTYRRVKGQ